MILRRLGAGALVALAAVPFAFATACSGDDPANSGPVNGAPTSTGTATGPDSTPDAGGETDGSSDANADAGPKAVEITFAAKVGSTSWSCGATFPSLGTANTTVAPLDFRFYVHDVRLLRSDDVEVPVSLTVDDKWQTATVALLDFEDGTGTCSDGNADTNAVVKGEVPAGSYKGLAFKVGVPFTENHGNPATAASPLNVMQMSWSWLSGYRFMKIDTQPLGDGGSTPPKFNLHIGRQPHERREGRARRGVRAPESRMPRSVPRCSEARRGRWSRRRHRDGCFAR